MKNINLSSSAMPHDLIAEVEFYWLPNGNLVHPPTIIFRKEWITMDRTFNAKLQLEITDSETGKRENYSCEETCNMTLPELGEYVAAVYPPLLKSIPELNAKFLQQDLAESV